MARIQSVRNLLIGGLLGLAVLLSGCSQSPAATPAAGPARAPLARVTAETVRRGDIQQTLAYGAGIRAREQVNVLPKATGRVEQVLVDVGSRVQAGDLLVVLDQDAAMVQVLEARAALAGAQAKLASIEAGPRADDVAAAEAAVAQQQVRLQNMLAGGRAEDVQLAEAGLRAQQARLDLMLRGGRGEAVEQAQAALEAATARLNALEKGATDDVRQAAQSAVDADRAALASAEAAYAAIGGSTAADLQTAQSQVDTLTAQVQAAEATVASADAALANLKGSGPADVQAAQSAYDTAVAQRAAAQAALDQAYRPTQAALNQAQAALEQARAQRQAAEAQQSALENNAADPCLDHPGAPRNSTACGEAKGAADAAVMAGNAAIEAMQAQLDLLKRGGSPAQQAQVQAQLEIADAQVRATRARLEAVKTGGIEAQRALLQAQKEQSSSQLIGGQQSLRAAQARLDSLHNGTLEAQVQSAAAQVTAARERLKSDQARLQHVLDGPTDEDLRQAEAGVQQAAQQVLLAEQPSTDQDIRAQREAVEQARLQLQKAQSPYTDYDVQQQRQTVAQAEAQLRSRQHPYTDQELAAAQAAVDQARAQLDLADLGLNETRVLAPVDGVVAARQVAPGALVNPQTPLVSLVPPSLELVVNVEESHLGEIAEGQAVELQVAAFPAQTFTGRVRTIAPTVDDKSRTTEVRIEPSDDTGKLLPGMFAQLHIVTAATHNALVVPREAILAAGAGTSRMVVIIDDDGKAHRQPVTLGLQNDRQAEILSGLDYGQLVATSGMNDLKDGDLVAPQVERLTAHTPAQ